jgi:hypothetical protein
MPTTETFPVTVADAQGRVAQTVEVTCRRWTRRDAQLRAIRYGAAVFAMCLLMLPIPIVHFFAIPVALVGIPLVTFLVYRLYSGGADLSGKVRCPSCGQEIELRAAGDQWPVSRNCPDCRGAYLLERA